MLVWLEWLLINKTFVKNSSLDLTVQGCIDNFYLMVTDISQQQPSRTCSDDYENIVM